MKSGQSIRSSLMSIMLDDIIPDDHQGISQAQGGIDMDGRAHFEQRRMSIQRAAARLIRVHGITRVSVVAVMHAAGFSHGPFYGYFRSKGQLVAEAIRFAAAERRAAAAGRGRIARISTYLSVAHRDDQAHACPVSSLSMEARRDVRWRAEVTAHIRDVIFDMTQDAGGPAGRGTALLEFSALVGAMALSRVTCGTDLSDEILDAARSWLLPKVI